MNFCAAMKMPSGNDLPRREITPVVPARLVAHRAQADESVTGQLLVHRLVTVIRAAGVRLFNQVVRLGGGMVQKLVGRKTM